jgi:hypothetical protein
MRPGLPRNAQRGLNGLLPEIVRRGVVFREAPHEFGRLGGREPTTTVKYPKGIVADACRHSFAGYAP